MAFLWNGIKYLLIHALNLISSIIKFCMNFENEFLFSFNETYIAVMPKS